MENFDGFNKQDYKFYKGRKQVKLKIKLMTKNAEAILFFQFRITALFPYFLLCKKYNQNNYILNYYIGIYVCLVNALIKL